VPDGVEGDDVLRGIGGVNADDYSTNADKLWGGLGNDVLDGREGGGKTKIFGDAGDDRLYGDVSRTTSSAGPASTPCAATRNPITFEVATGTTYLHGGSGILDKGEGQAGTDACLYIRHRRQTSCER